MFEEREGGDRHSAEAVVRELATPLSPFSVLAVRTEQPELKGYRVRLRVTKEYDVALLPAYPPRTRE